MEIRGISLGIGGMTQKPLAQAGRSFNDRAA